MSAHRAGWSWRLAYTAAVLALAGGLAPLAWAEKADHDKPTHIDYDNSEFDDLHQIYVFTGHVILTKGTILIRCDKLVVKRDPENYEYGTATMDAPGKLVYFHQKREGFADQYIEGEGERIEYDEKADLAKIFVKAVVRRLDGGVLQDEIRGDMVQYNSTTEQYLVEAGGNGGRAHALFAPAKTATPAAGAPGAPTAGSATPAPNSGANSGASSGAGPGTSGTTGASAGAATGGSSGPAPNAPNATKAATSATTPATPNTPLKSTDTLQTQPDE